MVSMAGQADDAGHKDAQTTSCTRDADSCPGSLRLTPVQRPCRLQTYIPAACADNHWQDYMTLCVWHAKALARAKTRHEPLHSRVQLKHVPAAGEPQWHVCIAWVGVT